MRLRRAVLALLYVLKVSLASLNARKASGPVNARSEVRSGTAAAAAASAPAEARVVAPALVAEAGFVGASPGSVGTMKAVLALTAKKSAGDMTRAR